MHFKSFFRSIIFFSILCYTSSFLAQNISGTLVDSKGNHLNNVRVILKDNNDKIVKFIFTSEQGFFEFNNLTFGDYQLLIQHMNLEKKVLFISLEEESKNFNETILLVDQEKILEEILIDIERPIKIQKDTITFKSASFLQGDEKVIEDLIKKLPGFNVTSDGTIKIGNQEIEKVMVDGDDFFEKGYKVLTKNMPVKPVEGVQLLQRYSNNKLLKGIENSQKVALNLTLTEDAKREWFGNLELGYGVVSEDRYSLRGNAMNFGKNNKYYFLSNLNNTGLNATGDINHLIRPIRSGEPSAIGDDQQIYSFLNIENSTLNLNEQRINFNNAELISLNSIFNLTPKLKLKLLGFLNTDENDLARFTTQSYFAEGIEFDNVEDYNFRKRKFSGFGKIDLSYDLSKNKTFEYTLKLNRAETTGVSNLLFNKDPLKERLKTDNELLDNKLVFTHKISETKVFLFSGRYIKETKPQIYQVNRFLRDDRFTEKVDNLKQANVNQMEFAGVETHFFSKGHNGSLFEIKLGNEYRKDLLETTLELFEGSTKLDQPIDYKNSLVYKTNDLYLKSNYIFRIGYFNVIPNIEFHQLSNKLENFQTDKEQSPFFIIPKLTIQRELNARNKIQASYSYGVTNSGLQHVYDKYIRTDFRTAMKGTGELQQLNESTVSFSYNLGNWNDRFFATLFLLYNKNHDFFSTQTWLTQNYTESNTIVLKDKELWLISGNADYYIKSIKTNVKFLFDGTQSDYKNILNDSELRKVKSLNIGYGFELRSIFKGVFNYNIGTKWTYNQYKTEVLHSYSENTSFLNLNFIMSKKLNFNIKSEVYYYGGSDRGKDTYSFLDFGVNYTRQKDRLTFSLTGNNLLNTKNIINYNISDVSISETSYRLVPRYLLLSVEFGF